MNKCLLLAASLLLSPMAYAQQSSASFTVNTIVEASCEVVSTQNLLFGLYDPVGVNRSLPSRASGNIRVRCTNGTTNVKITLSEGQHAASGSNCTTPRRQMRSASGAFLPYIVFQEADEINLWGCAATTSRALPTFETLSPTTVPTYGLIPAGQDVPVGTYQDIVEVSVSF